MNLATKAQLAWEKSGFTALTPIQTASYKKIRAGKNLLAISPTGSGKTLAYLLPQVDRLEANHQLQLLILAPSQELAQQIGAECRQWLPVKTQVITGGANLRRQIDKLKEKPEVIVATPGRLLEISQQSKKIKFHHVKTLVIDEADYLLSDEHLGTVREIAKKAPSQRQVLCYSATHQAYLDKMPQWFACEVETLEVASESQMDHLYLLGEDRKRGQALKRLAQLANMQALVFVNNVANLATLYEKMAYEGLSVGVLHSQMHHIDRQKAIRAFKEGQVQFLLTTDIAARGIDIENLPYVIQYDLPREKEIYTHRAGRTGRMGKKGTVISLVSESGLKELKKLVGNQKPQAVRIYQKKLEIEG